MLINKSRENWLKIKEFLISQKVKIDENFEYEKNFI